MEIYVNQDLMLVIKRSRSRPGRTPMIVSLFFVYLLSVAMHFLANLDESVYFATLDKARIQVRSATLSNLSG